MIQIRPVSQLRNNFPAIEKVVKGGEPVYLTKNGYGSMVVLSLEQYAELTGDIELKLDEADREATLSDKRLSHEDVFGKYRRHSRLGTSAGSGSMLTTASKSATSWCGMSSSEV